jgi:replicative DNA helicase
MTEATFDRGLPVNVEAEKVCLGAIMLSDSRWDEVRAIIGPDDFMLEKHRRIFRRMDDLRTAGKSIDRITVANELMSVGQLESVDGLSYLVSLDQALPENVNVKGYAEIVRQKSMERRAIMESAAIAKSLVMGAVDLKTALAKSQHSMSEIQARMDGDSQKVQSAEQIVTANQDEIFYPWQGAPGLSTGFPKLDEYLSGGLLPKHVYCIAAESSSGKTALAASISHTLMKDGNAVLYFTGEMGFPVMIQRLAAIDSGLSFTRFRRNWLPEEQAKNFRHSIMNMAQLPFYADDTHPITIHDCEMRIRKAVKDHSIKCVVVDYIQIMDRTQSGNGIFFKEERLALDYICVKFVTIAKEMNIPVVFLSQFSRAKRTREKADRRPKLSDLFGASSIENSSHVVIMIYREEFDNPTADNLKNTAEFLIRKNRNGPRGTVKARFLPGCMAFIEDPLQPEATQ